MAVNRLENPRFRTSVPGGTVTVYEAGTSTKTTIWSDSDQSAELSNPVTLDSNGEKEIWFDGSVKVVVADSQGVQQFTMDNVKSDLPPADIGRFNLVENGSFEIDSTGDDLPDSWTITEDDATSTVEIDSTNVAHGTQSLKFVSQGSGGGTATTNNFFQVNAGQTCVVVFTIRSTVADVRNKVQVRYFDKDGTFVSADDVYDEDTSNPTSFEEKRFVSSVPASATQAKLRLIGCDPADSTTGTTYFDDIKVYSDQQAAVYSSGTAVKDAVNFASFPNVNADVTATDEELNTLDGFTGSTTDLNSYPSLETPVDATNGGADNLTEIDFTGIKSGARRITVLLNDTSLSGTDNILIQIGDSGGIETSGYDSSSSFITPSAQDVNSSSAGFVIIMGGNGITIFGSLVLYLLDSSNNTWVASHAVGETTNTTAIGGGRKSLSGELDRVRIKSSGTDTFDGGTINILIE